MDSGGQMGRVNREHGTATEPWGRSQQGVGGGAEQGRREKTAREAGRVWCAGGRKDHTDSHVQGAHSRTVQALVHWKGLGRGRFAHAVGASTILTLTLTPKSQPAACPRKGSSGHQEHLKKFQA